MNKWLIKFLFGNSFPYILNAKWDCNRVEYPQFYLEVTNGN